ncbi:MAG: phasin family protein [Cellvibrionaceae bacterium]|nr:phasin family protein [Cellvibrionaceae bacterium]
MTDFNEQFKEFAKLQSEFFKPLREANGLLADSFESFTRLGYSTSGDMVDYAIDQTQLMASAESPTDLMSKQYEKAKELGETITGRFNECAELGKEFFASLQKVEVAPMFEAPAKATAKAAKAAKTAAA